MKSKFVTIFLAVLFFQPATFSAVYEWEKLTVSEGQRFGVVGDPIETCFEIEATNLCLWEECGLKFLDSPISVDLDEFLGKGCKVIGFKLTIHCCKIAVLASDKRVFFFSCRIKNWLRSVGDQGQKSFEECSTDLERLLFMFCHDNNNLPRLFLESSIEFCTDGFVAISLYSFHGWGWLRVLDDSEIKKIDLTYEFGVEFTFVNKQDSFPRFGSKETATLLLMSTPAHFVFGNEFPEGPIGKILCSWNLLRGNR